MMVAPMKIYDDETMVMMIPIKITIMMMKFIGHGKYLELITIINRDT